MKSLHWVLLIIAKNTASSSLRREQHPHGANAEQTWSKDTGPDPEILSTQ